MAGTCSSLSAATMSMSTVDRGSPASELAMEPPIELGMPSASSVPATVTATPIGSTGVVTK
jgi:hypothetical protein